MTMTESLNRARRHVADWPKWKRDLHPEGLTPRVLRQEKPRLRWRHSDDWRGWIAGIGGHGPRWFVADEHARVKESVLHAFAANPFAGELVTSVDDWEEACSI